MPLAGARLRRRHPANTRAPPLADPSALRSGDPVGGISDAEAAIAGEHRATTGLLRGETAILFDATSTGIHLRAPGARLRARGVKRHQEESNCKTGHDRFVHVRSATHKRSVTGTVVEDQTLTPGQPRPNISADALDVGPTRSVNG